MVIQPILVDLRKFKKNSSFTRTLSHSFRLSNSNPNDHSRRLIQTAYVRFQQLNECDDLNGEQKQWIQTWMDAVSNVSWNG